MPGFEPGTFGIGSERSAFAHWATSIVPEACAVATSAHQPRCHSWLAAEATTAVVLQLYQYMYY